MLVRMKISGFEINEVTTLFRFHDWEMNEIQCEEIDGEANYYIWTLDITEMQKDSIRFMVEDVVFLDDESDLDAPRRQLTLNVTAEQEELLKKFLADNNMESTLEMGDGHHDLHEPPTYLIPPKPGRQQCQECLCTPCVLAEDHRQEWWPTEPRAPHEHNNIHRKKLYYKFWTMLYHRGYWCNPFYLEKKARARPGINVAKCKRDIMPNCVVEAVKRWLPNVTGQPYMGHKWQ